MIDPETTKAVAGAVEETAKATGKGFDIVHDTGGYLRHVFGEAPADIVGVLGGAWLHERHIRIRDKYRRRTEQIVRERDVQEFVELSPNLATALIGGAQDESREELMELWARLLANAMDPNLSNVRQSFIEAVKKMDPPDGKLLHYIYNERVVRVRPGDGGNKTDTSVEFISRELCVRYDDVVVSIDNLKALGFFTIPQSGDQNIWFPSSKFKEFMRACYPELQP
jgi:hypothetical protein